MIHEFFSGLKDSLERHSKELMRGEVFLPEHLSNSVLTGQVFPQVARTLASAINFDLAVEVPNPMPSPPEFWGHRQVVDFVLSKDSLPRLFFELESLDRAQLYLCREHPGISKENNDNKLWYYYGTLVNHVDFGLPVPKYFVWLLILPDRQVKPYQIWDVTPEYQFFHPSLRDLVYTSPYRFYDHLIKSSARNFLTRPPSYELRDASGREPLNLIELQDKCELVFITCTGNRLSLSRGKDCFDPRKELSVDIDWRTATPGV